MEPLEFLKEYRRMCNSYIHRFGCEGCPLTGKQCLGTGVRNKTDSEYLTITSTVEQWSKENPIITNADKFKEVFELPTHCMIDQDAQWWDEPYKEPKHEAMR